MCIQFHHNISIAHGVSRIFLPAFPHRGPFTFYVTHLRAEGVLRSVLIRYVGGLDQRFGTYKNITPPKNSWHTLVSIEKVISVVYIISNSLVCFYTLRFEES